MKKVIEEHKELTSEMIELLTKIHFTDTFSTTNHRDNIKDITNLISKNANVSKKEIYNFCFKIKNEK